MDPSPRKPPQDAVTVRRLRLGIGVVGTAMPIVLVVGQSWIDGRPTLLGSISSYYHSDMRDVFVGSMCAIGVFLVCYRYRWLDDVLSTTAGVLAIAVALFPTPPDLPGEPTSTDRAVGLVHQISAAVLFLLLAVFCLFLFTRGTSARPTPEKRVRDRIYYACGGIILGCVALGVASNALPDSIRDTLRPLFWCEAAAVFTFGVAWLVKSEALFTDAQEPREG